MQSRAASQRGSGIAAAQPNVPSVTCWHEARDRSCEPLTTRPHRPARETRTALTDTLLLAEQGLLDRKAAELLLLLSFYPVGTAVEMGDGAGE